MRNIVTGGAGFLGSHLIDTLMREGEEVICIDNFSSGVRNNIQHWINNPMFTLINHDVIEPIFLKSDKIWHLASPASPKYYLKNPIKTLQTNFLGTSNLLELAKKTKAKILLASTSEVYGNPIISPQKENYNGCVNPIGKRGCYEEGKRIAETLLYDYKRKFNLDIRLVRIFNTYGPRMLKSDGRVVCNFIYQALNNVPLTIYGDGSQTRSFCYVDDMIKGLKFAMDSNYSRPINLGNPEEISILELAKKICLKLKKKLSVEFKLLPEDDPLHRKPCILIAKKKLNWQPKENLDIGLEKTIDYFLNNNYA